MENVFAVLAFVTGLFCVYAVIGLAFPRLPLIGSRKRAALQTLGAFVVFLSAAGIGMALEPPEERAAREARNAAEQATRKQERLAREAEDSARRAAGAKPSDKVAEPDPSAAARSGPFSAKSRKCVEVVGQTAKDRDNALAFCANTPSLESGVIIGLMAMESLVWVKVPRPIADAMRNDRLSTEQIVKNWMKSWRALHGRPSVTIYVEWQDVEIARGETTLLGGDVVTIR